VSVHAEAIIDTADGTFLIRDALADTSADQRAAARASEVSGRRGGRMLGAAGSVLQVRCAHQFSSPSVRIEVLTDPAPPGAGPWHWEKPSELSVLSGRIGAEGDLRLTLELEAAPGRYVVLVGHQGRRQMQEAAFRAEEAIQAGEEETSAAWQRLQGIEKYLVRLWPAPARSADR
jgi:hypothetical protein